MWWGLEGVLTTQSTPKVEQVRQVFMATVEAVQVVSTESQNPMLLSDEHARYGWQVSYGTWPEFEMYS